MMVLMALLDASRGIFRWVSLNHQVNITENENLSVASRKNMKIMVDGRGFEMDQLALWGDEWVVEYHDRGNNHTTQFKVRKIFKFIFIMTS